MIQHMLVHKNASVWNPTHFCEQASRATAQGMWVALLTGAALQAAVWAKAPDIVACEEGALGDDHVTNAKPWAATSVSKSFRANCTLPSL